MRAQILSMIIASTAAAVAAIPAHAQQAAAPNYQYVQTTPQAQMRPGVRYTTGAYVVTPAGFEKGLTNYNPNLGHWNWSPVIGYTQGSLRTGKQAAVAPNPERKSVYVKPIHVPLPVVNHPQALASKPESLQMVPVKSANGGSNGSSNHRSNTGTQIVLSYNKDYRISSGDNYRSRGDVHGILANQSVGAKLSQNAQY